MENLTFERGLVKPHKIEPLRGHTVVVLERVGAGEEVRYDLEPGRRTLSKGIFRELFAKRRSDHYFAFAIPKAEFRDAYSMVVTLYTGAIRLDIDVSYTVTDARRLVARRNDDPLRGLRDEIETAVRSGFSLQSSLSVENALGNVRQLVEGRPEDLQRFAADRGLRLDKLALCREFEVTAAVSRPWLDELRRKTVAERNDFGRDFPRRNVALRALWPATLPPNTPAPFRAYVSGSAAGAMAVAADISSGKESWRSAIVSRLTSEPLERITVLPLVAGIEFTPPAIVLQDVGTWARADFQMQAVREQTCQGSVQFFAGPVLIGEVAISVQVAQGAPQPLKDVAAQSYRNIFVSYAHTDGAIVDRLGQAYQALGDQYLRDVEMLRSGEQWNPALLAKIEQADVFQLCWSAAAKQSRYVEQEWRYALDLHRRLFVRPVYWQKPLPEPPAELAPLHFAFLEL
ncbi:MAG TPA: toll/interleukin-1 receptor domain-containing protein [Thermoanaerobaculia bacterium]|nr:toll/interleukin-1 receptor domain-containing protein [Thermoanaerobaculia bacterium]